MEAGAIDVEGEVTVAEGEDGVGGDGEDAGVVAFEGGEAVGFLRGVGEVGGGGGEGVAEGRAASVAAAERRVRKSRRERGMGGLRGGQWPVGGGPW